jgi:flagellar hook-length control protein FliK
VAGSEERSAKAVTAEHLQAAVTGSQHQGGSSSDARSGDHGGTERRASLDVAWLRRASTLEARLAPPAFAVPTVAPGGPSMPTAAAVATGVHVPFEMPAPAENLSRLVQSIHVQARDGVSQASLRLNPEHLGEVTIAIRVDGGTVTALVRAEAGDVRLWLRSQEDTLRAALAEQGLTLDEFVVEQDGRRGQDDEQPRQQQARRNRTRGYQGQGPSFDVTA